MKKELMPPNTKKCGHEGNYSACLCGTYDALLEGVVDTPSLDKSEHDGTCRTPECYEKRPTPAVEKCGCPVPNGIFKQKGRTAWYECSKCGKGIEFTITPTPEKEKCKSCNDFGFWTDSSGKPYKCNEASHTKPTPAVEDWEIEFNSFFGVREFKNKTASWNPPDVFTIKNFIRSLRESDRKRIVEGLGKMRKYHKEFECNGAHGGKGCYESWCEDQNCRNAPKEYNQAISDAITFITNLK